VKDGVSGLVLNEPSDADEIARLIRICMEKEKAAAMGRAARALALEYSVTANADHTEAIYCEVAAEKNRELGQTAAAAGQG
jgi:glycosyltransferase involved in cell wall biosynthesis